MKGWMGAGMAALVTYACGAGALACGDTIVNTTTVYTDGGGAGDAADGDAVPEGARDTGGSEVEGSDAGVDGDAGPVECVASDSVGVSDECTVLGPCTGCVGAKESYACEETDGGTRPDIDGCESRGLDADGRTTWCCPVAACVRSASAGELCGGHGYVCPFLPGTSTSMAPQGDPGWQCDNVFNGAAQGVWCCHIPFPPMP